MPGFISMMCASIQSSSGLSFSRAGMPTSSTGTPAPRRASAASVRSWRLRRRSGRVRSRPAGRRARAGPVRSRARRSNSRGTTEKPSAPSGPDISEYARARSRIVRAIGPACQNRRGSRGHMPVSGMRPYPAGSLQPGDGGRVGVGDAPLEDGRAALGQHPAVSNESLTVNGTPCSGPTSAPSSSFRSAARARRAPRRRKPLLRGAGRDAVGDHPLDPVGDRGRPGPGGGAHGLRPVGDLRPEPDDQAAALAVVRDLGVVEVLPDALGAGQVGPGGCHGQTVTAD